MKIYIIGGDMSYTLPFTDLGHAVVVNPEQADILVFTGGADVDPNFYSEQTHPHTSFTAERDTYEQLMYNKYFDKIKVGICRGSQFLNVMNGGKLIQHMDGHATGSTHTALHIDSGELYSVTSTHHQGVILTDGSELLVESAERLSKTYWTNADTEIEGFDEVEAYQYLDTKTLGIQFHPEYVHYTHPCRTLFNKCLSDFLWEIE